MCNQELHYASDDEIQSLVEGFESCRLPPADFDHRAHLAVAIWYLSRMTRQKAIERMREGLLRFIDCHGVNQQKYNETITQFWIKRASNLFNQTDSERPLADRVNEVINRSGGAQLVFDYYSRDLVFSEEARTGWIEPDIKSNDDALNAAVMNEKKSPL